MKTAATSRTEYLRIVRRAEKQVGQKSRPGLSMCLQFELPLWLHRKLWMERNLNRVLDALEAAGWKPTESINHG